MPQPPPHFGFEPPAPVWEILDPLLPWQYCKSVEQNLFKIDNSSSSKFESAVPSQIFTFHLLCFYFNLIFTDRKGKVMFSQVSVCPQLASWLLVHWSALLRRGRYASYWNAFLLTGWDYLWWNDWLKFQKNIKLKINIILYFNVIIDRMMLRGGWDYDVPSDVFKAKYKVTPAKLWWAELWETNSKKVSSVIPEKWRLWKRQRNRVFPNRILQNSIDFNKSLNKKHNFKNFLENISPFCGAADTPDWTSGGVCPGFQIKSGSLTCV